jgi:hypothetical protein
MRPKPTIIFKAPPGNPYDGHMLATVIPDMEALVGKQHRTHPREGNTVTAGFEVSHPTLSPGSGYHNATAMN